MNQRDNQNGKDNKNKRNDDDFPKSRSTSQKSYQKNRPNEHFKAIHQVNQTSKQLKNIEFDYFAPCPRGLEGVLRNELIEISESHDLNLKDIEETQAGVSFAGDINAMYWVNLYSRVASRLLILVKKGNYYHEDDLYHAAKRINWLIYFNEKQNMRLDLTAHRSPLPSLNYANLSVKDGICDYFREKTGIRPDIEKESPNVRVFTHLDEREFFIYLDTSGESLFKRGWRIEKGVAPIKENLAAAIIHLSGWLDMHKQGIHVPLLDGMCGSGTLTIEAAQMAKNYPAGFKRKFAFNHLKLFSVDAWEAIYQKAEKSINQNAQMQIQASDIEEYLTVIAKENAERANIQEIEFSTADIQTLMPPKSLLNNDIADLKNNKNTANIKKFDDFEGFEDLENFNDNAASKQIPQNTSTKEFDFRQGEGKNFDEDSTPSTARRNFNDNAASKQIPQCLGVMVINPPYGERIFVKQGEQLVLKQDLFFTEWASHLKKNYAGWKIFVLSADLTLSTQMRLKPKRKTVLFNGDLECRLFEFEMVDGSMRT